MKELKYTWRVKADDDNQGLLKLRALTTLGDKLEAKEIELLSKSKCLACFVSYASIEAEGKQVVLPLTAAEEKRILRWRNIIRLIKKLLPFIK